MMRKCPFCNAEIEENARFCLYCMSSLEEKQIIETKTQNKKGWLFIIAAFLLLVLVIILICITLKNTDLNETANSGSDESYIIAVFGENYEASVLSESNSSVDSSVDSSSAHSYTKTDSDKTETEDASRASSQNSSITSSQSHTNSDASSSTKPTESSASEKTDSNTSTSQSSSEQSSSEATETKTEATYIYRDAVAADCYTEGNIPTSPIEDVIVITGVATAASDGIYVIPEQIDGKRVGAIMQSAFCDAAICGGVKKVVVPSSVKTIWENAFSSCYNLTDIYLYGNIIDIFESSFADVSRRTGTLTIHCAYDCVNSDYYYYRNIAYKYDAQYANWNGGDYD